MIRELNSRQDNSIIVNLLWDDETDEVFVEIDTEEGQEMFPVPADEAMQAFQHPFVYAVANSHGHHVTV